MGDQGWGDAREMSIAACSRSCMEAWAAWSPIAHGSAVRICAEPVRKPLSELTRCQDGTSAPAPQLGLQAHGEREALWQKHMLTATPARTLVSDAGASATHVQAHMMPKASGLRSSRALWTACA